MSFELGVVRSPGPDRTDLTSVDERHAVVAKDFALHAEPSEEGSDIYRGDPPRRPATPDADSVSTTSTASSSSSDSSLIGRRLGAIAAVVEHAIARWARNNPSVSSTASSISSASSVRTGPKSLSRRRRRRPSLATLTSNLQSEREVAARIKAREESRYTAREFTLYLPKSLSSGLGISDAREKATKRPVPERVARTTSLPIVLHHLEAALKRSTKVQRHYERIAAPRPRAETTRNGGSILPHHDYMIPNDLDPKSRPSSFPDLTVLHLMKKGKRKENGVDPGRTTPSSGTSTPASKARQVFPQRAWWLDVASPTWEDMKAIGQLLHIHPLTLEDILQQDPREKLELFPKLGYYFIVFKALESVKTQERFFRSQLNGDTYFPQDEGFVGEAMVYLVVFREGVISFHYSDISEHTDRVRNKLLLMDEDVNVSNASSDWIAHGILDSIVDSFFPFQEGIEMEIAAIEDLVFSDNHLRLKESPLPEVVTPNFQMPEKPSDAHPKDEEKRLAPAERTRTRFADPTPTIPLLVRRLRRAIRSRILPKAQISTETKSAMSSTAMTLRRMAKARRLLTTSTRLLSTKHEVVAQIKKRLLNEGALPKGTGAGDEIEVAMYMGDVQDHILTLQHSLVHYERILSQLHPTYLSQLRVSVSTTKQGSDKAIMVLSIVSIAVLCCQAVIGCFSMNVTVPTNGQEPGYPYNMFYVVLSIAVVALCLYGCLVRYWWVRSKRRRTTML